MRTIRLTAVLTHPIQYYAPWFRWITREVPALDLTVLYAAEPSPEQQGVGFGRPLTWDVPLVDGYRARVVRRARAGERVDSERFFGLDVREIGSALGDTRPDVVLVAGWYSVTLVRAILAARRLGVPVIYRGDTHGDSAPAGLRGLAWRLKTRALLSAFSAHLSVGVRAKDLLLGLGRDHRGVFDAPPAVDNAFFRDGAAPHQTPAGRRAARDHFGLPADGFVVLSVGKLEPKKYPLDAIEAVARCRVPTTLLVVGSGELEHACREKAERLGIDATFAGFLNQSELGRAYAAADCLVLPSDWGETWGLVVNEAFATGLPAVVSDRVGCAPDLIDDATGATYPFGDVEALAAAISDVRDRAAAGHRYGPACRSRIARFGFDRATAGLIAACDWVAGGDRAAAPATRVLACCGHMVTVTGLERMTFEVLRTARAHGAAVHCIVNSWEHHRIVKLADGVGASWSIGAYRRSLGRRLWQPLRLVRMIGDIIRTSAGLLRDVRRVGPTVILMPEHNVAARNLPALVWLRLRGVRVVMRLGNAPATSRFYRWYWRWLMNPLTDRFVGNSQFTERELLSLGVPAGKVAYVHNIVPARECATAPAAPRVPGRIIYVGQILPDKGLDLLLDAVAILVARGSPVSLDVVGNVDGWIGPEYRPFRDRVKARAEAADLAGRVTFLGWREEVPALFARASLHCMPSRPEAREGFGVVNLEAKLAGVPSVVFAGGALPELFTHGEDGWIAQEVSGDALAEGLEYFLSDPERLAAAGDAARRSLDRFSSQRFDACWWQVLSGFRVQGSPSAVLQNPEPETLNPEPQATAAGMKRA